MGYCVGETKNIKQYIKDVRDGNTGEQCFCLIKYLVNGECIRRGIMLTEEAFWDISVDIYLQIKERIERKKITSDGILVRDIQDPVAYIYFATPKRFCAMISKKKKRDDNSKITYNIDDYSDSIAAIDDFEKIELPEQNEILTNIILEYLGEATTNKDLKYRRQKVRSAGYIICRSATGQITAEDIGLTQKEIDKIRDRLDEINDSSLAKWQEYKKRMTKYLDNQENKKNGKQKIN